MQSGPCRGGSLALLHPRHLGLVRTLPHAPSWTGPVAFFGERFLHPTPAAQPVLSQLHGGSRGGPVFREPMAGRTGQSSAGS